MLHNVIDMHGEHLPSLDAAQPTKRLIDNDLIAKAAPACGVVPPLAGIRGTRIPKHPGMSRTSSA
jgi:hypothetical protein